MSHPNSHLARLSGALFLLGLAASAARSEIPLQFAGGDDRWSQQVSRQMLPRSHEALAALETFAETRYGVKLDGRMRLLMQATPAAPLPDESRSAGLVLKVEAGMGEAELRQHALMQPLRQGMLGVVDELSGGQARSLPAWLPWGLAETVARQLVRRLRSRSVAVMDRDSPAASKRKLERMGMVVLRSTTPCVAVSSCGRAPAAAPG